MSGDMSAHISQVANGKDVMGNEGFWLWSPPKAVLMGWSAKPLDMSEIRSYPSLITHNAFYSKHLWKLITSARG
jgi:hypothetical protein